MCGICGTAHPTEAAARLVLEAMCAAMTYRGPDEDGFLLRDGVGLGMRRLSIIDLATGTQPIFNESGSVGIVFNGEIYNYPQLRRELTEDGHTFATQSDTEVIVHGYEQHGPAYIERLNGMFALALYDAEKERLLLARDRTGQKPLFYHHQADGSLIFASELPTLLASGRVPRAVDSQAIWHYLSTQYVMGPRTILRDVYQLPAAHYAIWEDGALSLHRYWEPRYVPDTSLTRRAVGCSDAVYCQGGG
jgi:asparagine synthase (glutamine-hydrolysing)